MSKPYPISKINIDDTKVELNCRSVKAVLLYFEERHGREKLEEFIHDTKMNLDYLENRDNWVSYNYWCRLLKMLVEYTGDPRAPFFAGTYATKKECFGSLQTFFSRLGTTGAVYKLITEITPRYSKLNKFTLSDLKKNSCIIAVQYFDKYKQNKNNCLSLQGIFASIPAFWNLPLAKVRHTQCAADGADSCVYQFTWRNKAAYFFGLCGLFAGLSLSCINFFLWPKIRSILFIIIPILGYLIGRIKDYKTAIEESADIIDKESADLLESIEAIEKLNVELQDKVEQRTGELQKALYELERNQDQLIQSEKMASVGRLAAGMAHELNNPVGAVRNYIQDLLEDTKEDDPCYERLKGAERATDRCKRIVNDLLTFSREYKEMRLYDINDIIEATILNARVEIPNPNISIIKDLKPDLPMVRVDYMQLQQVFMNIIMNASDAIKENGEIHIKNYADQGKIIVEISDTGKGIDKDIQDRIFDPFFTTKGPRNGMGLGLAISYNIIKRFDGDIEVKSRIEKGTIFTINLPIADERIEKNEKLNESEP